MKGSNMPSYSEVLQWASSFLADRGVDPHVAKWLMREGLDLSPTDLLVKAKDPMPAGDRQDYTKQVKLASHHYPAQYIVGHEWFDGHKFQVNPAALIPRPETEAWFASYIDKLSPNPLKLVDIGTGTGVIGISHKLRRPQDQVYLTDILDQTLDLARANAQRLGAEVHFVQGDFLTPLLDQDIHFDLIVSNPPYIAKEEWDEMDESVRKYEPQLALFADQDSLAAYQKILTQSKLLVSDKFVILLEIGYNQGQVVAHLAQETYPQARVKTWTDLAGLDRLVSVVV